MISGIPKNERWFLWALFAWIFMCLGPGLQLASKPVFIGPFPLLYVYCVVFFIVGLWLCYMVGYKLSFTQMPEDIEIASEEQEGSK